MPGRSAAIDTQSALVDLLRLAVAAHLHRLEHGALPRDAAALADAFGAPLPQDPFRAGAPLTVLPDERGLRLYSWWQDGEDDQGALTDRGHLSAELDLVVVVRTPRGS